jgi:FkbM family methyltransferase
MSQSDLDFVEIGTSDFDTIIQTCHNNNNNNNMKYGISVEPLKFYLDKLPNIDTVQKVNAAISDKDGEIEIYYTHPDDITKYNLPEWVKGCSSVGKPHPEVPRYFSHVTPTKITVPMYSMKTFITKYNIKSIKYLKIDTEGHDIVIMQSFYDYLIDNPNFGKPVKIQFESNSLADQNEVTRIIGLYTTKFGYKLVIRNTDTILEL